MCFQTETQHKELQICFQTETQHSKQRRKDTQGLARGCETLTNLRPETTHAFFFGFAAPLVTLHTQTTRGGSRNAQMCQIYTRNNCILSR